MVSLEMEYSLRELIKKKKKSDLPKYACTEKPK